MERDRTIVVNGFNETFCTNEISTTKYSLITFIPSFLFEQFRRYSNLYFLVIALLQQIPDVCSTTYTTVLPLSIILLASAIKEIAEDIKRNRVDTAINCNEVEVLRHGHWIQVKWKDVIVGNICKVYNDHFLPADMIVLSTSEPQSICYIETMNLDGETNLKIRQAPSSTARLQITRDFARFHGILTCEPPNMNLYGFRGDLQEFGKKHVRLSTDQIILRGAKLRNTRWVVAVVVYTGFDSKLMQNSTDPHLKRSTVDKVLNRQLILLVALLFSLCLISIICSNIWSKNHGGMIWYIHLDAETSLAYSLLMFIILYHNLVPISLQVTLESVRFIQALFIGMDIDLYDQNSDTPAVARTSNLNEELGQVKYIFSDKTGTLTRNIMEFKRATVGGIKYIATNHHPEQTDIIQNLRRNHSSAPLIKEFLTSMAICHTVIPERRDEEIIYHASSPDEKAILQGAAKFGYVFHTRTPETVVINALGKQESYEILNVLEFTSARKRMSVVVRTPEGRIKLYCKGADTVIYERLREEQQHEDTVLDDLEDFAAEGLRTLCFAMAEISDNYYTDWESLYYESTTYIHSRTTKADDVADHIEKNLVLLGATAIEDKLQDKVPETIQDLLRADIHVWMLTGDKQETAINIGHSCRLLKQEMALLFFNEKDHNATEDVIRKYMYLFGDNLGKHNDAALIIDGETLKYALRKPMRQNFLKLCVSCRAVICCRLSPVQKADLVELVSENTGAITLAIGDGANDVPMIQKANVGVGIAGEEGWQAACSSDYSIAQFRFLSRLLFIHGAWNYSRISKIILYSIYKNVTIGLMQFWFAIYNGWSAQIIFNKWTLSLYNLIFTAAAPMAMGLFDHPCSAAIKLNHPSLYRHCQRGQLFNYRKLVVWVANAVLHSAILFWLPMSFLESDTVWEHGKGGSYLLLGTAIYTYVVVAVGLKAGLETKSWTWPTHLSIWGSVLVWFIFLSIVSGQPSEICGIDHMMYSTPVFWAGLVLTPVTALLIDLTYKTVKNILFKDVQEAWRENEIENIELVQFIPARTVPNRVSRYSRRDSWDQTPMRGFSFSQQEGGQVTQNELIRAYDTTNPRRHFIGGSY